MESALHREEGLECSSSNTASKEFQIPSFVMQEIPEGFTMQKAVWWMAGRAGSEGIWLWWVAPDLGWNNHGLSFCLPAGLRLGDLLCCWVLGPAGESGWATASPGEAASSGPLEGVQEARKLLAGIMLWRASACGKRIERKGVQIITYMLSVSCRELLQFPVPCSFPLFPLHVKRLL